MLFGLLGSVLPGLPGVPLIFFAALVYAYLTGFEVVGGGILVLLGVFALIAFVSDFLVTSYGAQVRGEQLGHGRRRLGRPRGRPGRHVDSRDRSHLGLATRDRRGSLP